MKWFMPSWNGDHRLMEMPGHPYRGSDARIALEIKDPSPAEAAALRKFLEAANKKGWLPRGWDEGVVPERGTTAITLQATMNEAGKLLVKCLRRKEGQITAVTYRGGDLVVATSAESKVIETAIEKPEAEAAVTTKRGTMSCPSCIPVNERASEVLEAFLTPSQKAQWDAERAIVAVGSHTGVRYRIAHRGSREARRRKFIGWSIDDRDVIHYYDWSVPPEEEVLGMKLILEHLEPWARNPSGLFRPTAAPVFHNPLGDDYNDGVQDSGFVAGFGGAIMGGLVGGIVGGAS